METKVTIVVDNNAYSEIRGEWGLSVLVEHEGKKILVDTGASELFAENLEKLGYDISDIDFATLSHAHYDHSNGMPRFFKENSKAKFYVQESVAADCYFKKFFIRKYIGIPKNVISDYSDRIETVSGDFKLCDGVYLVPHKTKNLEQIGKREMMYRRTERGWTPDDFSHEQSLVVDSEKGLVIINSCSHGGTENIIREVRETFPDKHVYGLIGGFHLFNKSEKEVREVARKIKETGIDFVCTGHCTKNKAYSIMSEELGDKLEQMSVGYQKTF